MQPCSFLKRHAGLFLVILSFLSSIDTLRAQAPVALFSADHQTGCNPLLVTFTNLSTGAATYQWDFGNSNSSTALNPSTVFLAPGNYTVLLTATASNGLRDTQTMVITVVSNPVADFSATVTSGCEDQQVFSFTNLSQNSVSYTWDFGDGNASTATNPTHTYATPGTYTVKLIASNSFGCQDIKTRTGLITVYPQPNAQFSSNLTSSCSIATTFQFSGGPAASWSWSFGDGTTSSVQNPSHQYSTAGTYSVQLIVTSSQGCKDTVSHTNLISIGNSLVPSFTMSDTAGCGPLTIQFDATVPSATSWLWNFGDGTGASTASASHTYTNPGTYSISLTVTTTSGCNGSVTVPGLVVVDALPVPDFTVANDTGCVPFGVQFVNTSTGAATYFWDFHNGGSTNQTSPFCNFNQAGTYPITLTATSPNGCSTTITKNNFISAFSANANFTAAPILGCPGLTVQFTSAGNPANITAYLWTFGDGTSSTLANPSHTYNALGTYQVKLIATGKFGCKDTVVKNNLVQVINGQIPYTLPDTMKACQGVPFSFSDPTYGSNSWNWSFGNGTGSSSQSPSCTYQTPGVYIVTLTTTLPGGCSQTFNPFAIVEVIGYAKKPIDITYINRCKPYTVQFTTTTPDVMQFHWAFGDGDTSSLPNPIHIYQAAGTYNVHLTLMIGSGCIADLDTTVSFGHNNPIIASTGDTCMGELISFTSTDSVTFFSPQWLFGDGQSSTGWSCTHAYNSDGAFTPQLITTDTSGCIDTFSLAPIIISDPVPDFTTDLHACLNTLTGFNNNSSGADAYYWEFGDGTSETLENPSHIFTQRGDYTITLIASKNHCSKRITRVNYVHVDAPQINYSIATDGYCLPVTATFHDSTANGFTWHWDFGDGDTSNLQHPVHVYTTAPTGPIQVSVSDLYGCTTTTTDPNIQWYHASALINQTSGCRPLAVQFTDNSWAATGWLWDFGDGTTSTAQHPQHTYTTAGIFTITLIATFPGGCIDTLVLPGAIEVISPLVNFNSPTVAGCSPTQISFVNQTVNGDTYFWDLGDGSNSSQDNPSHIYYIPGDYTVSLIATSIGGCSDTLVRPMYVHIPGTWTHLELSDTLGCGSLTVQFTDSSINASSWQWNYGDGYLGNTQNPVHTYQDTGFYTVTLITHDTLGCSSSYTYPVPVHILSMPAPFGTASDTVGCEGTTVAFTNQSTNSVRCEWHFGDGDTSTLDAPTHTYAVSGFYQPYLIAYTSQGCADTFYLPQAVHILETPYADFSVSDSISCTTARIVVTDQSQFVSNATWSWDFGNGTTGAGNPAIGQFASAGTFAITMQVTNANGCSDSATHAINVHPSPVAYGTSDVQSGCMPLTVVFTDSSQGATGIQWLPGDGSNAVNSQVSTTYAVSSDYLPVIIAINNFGCTDTFNLPTIHVLNRPVAGFMPVQNDICPGSEVSFTNQSITDSGATYSWDFGFTTSTAASPFVFYGTPGDYSATLVVTNMNGCSDSLTRINCMHVNDNVAPAADPIYTATVESDTSVTVIWQNSSAVDLKTYVLYRFEPAQSEFIEIFRDTNAVGSSIAATSRYTDTGLDTRHSTYTYKLQTIDRCGYKLPIDSLSPSTTMELRARKAGSNVRLTWSLYQGCPVDSQEIYRTEVPSGVAQLIATVSNTTTGFIDTTIQCPGLYSYLIRATGLCATTYVSNSDTSAAQPDNDIDQQVVLVTRSTVVNNESVLTEWKPPVLHPERVTAYKILRSIDQINFTHIATVPAVTTSYTDNQVDVNAQEYYYKILVVNDCQLMGTLSGPGSSILLKGVFNNYRTTLNWTPYKEWKTGVDSYIIERQTPSGSWEQVKIVSGSETGTILNE